MGSSDMFPPLHPVPALRLAASLGSTLWSVGGLAGAAKARESAHSWARRTLAALGVDLCLEGPLPEGAQVWVANHLSWVDPLLFLSLRPMAAMAKAEVAEYPLIGAGARRVGLRFVNREDTISRGVALMGMVRDLRAGLDFLLFPEGTTTPGDRLAPLYEGGLRMAHRLGVRLLPLRLANVDGHYPWIGDDELLPHLRRLARFRRTRVTVRPGSVLDPAVCRDEEAWISTIRNHLDPAQDQDAKAS